VSPSFSVVAIPLRRPPIVQFLEARTDEPQGAPLRILAQRPTASARLAWVEHLREVPEVGVEDLLAISNPHAYLTDTFTDRLVPEQFLQEDGFLTRNLGGWSPVYFGVAALPEPLPADPLFDHLEVLADHGDAIQSFGADPSHVAERLPDEMGGDAAHVAAAVQRLHDLRIVHAAAPDAYVRALHAALEHAGTLQTDAGRPVPPLLLCEALMDALVATETERRAAHARHDTEAMKRLQAYLDRWADDLGLTLILKGEYIAGRHRRSTIVIAEDLGVVIKQPAPEPFHEIEMGARTFGGDAENWPRVRKEGAVVVPQGRVRLVLQEDVVPRLHRAFDHGVQFSSLLGLIVEDYVDGPTVQAWVQADPERMTLDLYEQIAATQQVCEMLHVDNPDWHSANFIVANSDARDAELVHIDWGAARPLSDEEQAGVGRRSRLDQVQNLAFSFHDDAIARRVEALHATLMGDADVQARVQRRAEEMVNPSA
jgi:hypothetical protein